MKTLFVVLAVLFCFAISTPSVMAQAQQNTKVVVDLKDLDYNTRNTIIKYIKDQEEATNQNKSLIDTVSKIDPDSVGLWVKAITNGIRDICKDLNVAVNEFIQTPVGIIVAGTLIYNVIGRDAIHGIKQIVFATLGWIISMAVMYFIGRKFLFTRKLEKIETYTDKNRGLIELKSYEFVKPYDFVSDDARSGAYVVAAAVTTAMTIVAIVVILS